MYNVQECVIEIQSQRTREAVGGRVAESYVAQKAIASMARIPQLTET
jgi:hypothetical protein